jgi:two-component system phosphate regulon sensor histidine kinase PhoR
MGQRRLLWYLFPSYLVITILALIAASFYAYHLLSKNYIQVTTEDLKSHALIAENQINHLLLLKQYALLDSTCKIFAERSGSRFTVILPSGRVVSDSESDPSEMDNHNRRPEIIQALQGQIGSSVRYSKTLDTELMYVALPVYVKNSLLGVLRISVPLRHIEKTLHDFQLRIIWAGMFITFIVGFISLVVARRISRPLEIMRHGVDKFAAGELSFRFKTSGSKEMSRLTNALNQMAEQLDDKIRKIIEQKNEQEAVLESMVEGVIAIDNDGRIINLNQAAARLFSIDAGASIGKHVYEMIKFSDLVDLIKRTLTDKQPVEEELTQGSDEQRLYLQVHGTSLKNAKEEVIGAVVVLNNVTRMRRLEKVRRDFVANVSHEIRTPLTTIKGFAETLLDGAAQNPKTARGFLKIISKQSDRLNAIIEDLLILARLEQEDDRVQLYFQQVPIKKILKNAIKVCEPAASGKNIKLTMQLEDNFKAEINQDLLEQAIVNLLDNAIKYSAEGDAVLVKAAEKDDSIYISVADNGVGIPKKHLPRLFERFYRVDKARSREQGGTGLGLAIVKHIVQVHNGTVIVESEAGKGSTFTIEIPGKSNLQKQAV